MLVCTCVKIDRKIHTTAAPEDPLTINSYLMEYMKYE